jgi:hypothetical protein
MFSKEVRKTKPCRKAQSGRLLKDLVAPLATLLGTAMCGLGDETNNPNLTTFQNFVNGRIPITEAVMCRKILSSEGKVLNQEWWRFGWQENTWYVQRVTPDGLSQTNFVPRTNSVICGHSWSHGWTISDENVHVAEKAFESGSKPDTFCAFERSLMFGALSLGLPRRDDVPAIQNAAINWDGLEFHSIVATSRDPTGKVLETSAISGKLNLLENGLTTSASYEGSGQFPGGSVAYEYRGENGLIPAAFTIKHPKREYRYEFLTLHLGSNDLSRTEGYVPSLFADLKVERSITLWTNDRPYSVINGKLQPAFGRPIHGEHAGRKSALLIMISLAVGAAIVLGLWYKRSG